MFVELGNSENLAGSSNTGTRTDRIEGNRELRETGIDCARLAPAGANAHQYWWATPQKVESAWNDSACVYLG